LIPCNWYLFSTRPHQLSFRPTRPRHFRRGKVSWFSYTLVLCHYIGKFCTKTHDNDNANRWILSATSEMWAPTVNHVEHCRIKPTLSSLICCYLCSIRSFQSLPVGLVTKRHRTLWTCSSRAQLWKSFFSSPLFSFHYCNQREPKGSTSWKPVVLCKLFAIDVKSIYFTTNCEDCQRRRRSAY
jgi:hypothetical protein